MKKKKKKVLTERPGLLRFDITKSLPIIRKPKETEVNLQDELHHSWQVIVLCVLVLLVMITGNWVVSSLQHAVARTGNDRDHTVAEIVSRPKNLRVSGLYSQGCRGRIVLQIIAHPDDDLAFMNPDTQAALDTGKCVRSVYLTAADHGWGLPYAEEREAGIRAAYDTMLGEPTDEWNTHSIKLPTGELLNVSDSPDSTPLVTLVFIRLPDGNLDGNGFSTTGEVSLRRLVADSRLKLTTLDEKATYTKQTLLQSLAEIIAVYQPTEIRTLGDAPTDVQGDHSDHIAAGEVTKLALEQYRNTYHDTTSIPLVKYIGYPIAGLQPNLSESEARKKENTFFTYARYDHNVCTTMEMCQSGGSSYAKYMSRCYVISRE